MSHGGLVRSSSQRAMDCSYCSLCTAWLWRNCMQALLCMPLPRGALRGRGVHCTACGKSDGMVLYSPPSCAQVLRILCWSVSFAHDLGWSRSLQMCCNRAQPVGMCRCVWLRALCMCMRMWLGVYRSTTCWSVCVLDEDQRSASRVRCLCCSVC